MACKSCTDKTSKYLKQLSKMGANTNFDIDSRKKEISGVWDKSMGKLRIGERLVLYIFAWVPLIVGYITLVRFAISLF